MNNDYYLSLYNDLFKSDYKEDEIWWIREIIDNPKQLHLLINSLKIALNWEHLTRGHILSDDFMREFKDEIDWLCVSKYQNLNEGFIREFKKYVNWEWISLCQRLSEDFIREFKDKVYWSWISVHQHLSEDFIREFKDCSKSFQSWRHREQII